LKRDNLDNYLR